MSIEEGKQAPAFTLPGSDGKDHTLSDYAGKTVVLFFYPKDNTPGCTKEACGFRDLQKEFDQHDAVVFGVSKDGLASHDKFIADFKLPFVLLSDPEARTMTTYGAWGEKNMYGKKSMGVIRSTAVIGPDGKISKHWKRVPDAAAHPDKVLEFLASQ